MRDVAVGQLLQPPGHRFAMWNRLGDMLPSRCWGGGFGMSRWPWAGTMSVFPTVDVTVTREVLLQLMGSQEPTWNLGEMRSRGELLTDSVGEESPTASPHLSAHTPSLNSKLLPAHRSQQWASRIFAWRQTPDAVLWLSRQEGGPPAGCPAQAARSLHNLPSRQSPLSMGNSFITSRESLLQTAGGPFASSTLEDAYDSFGKCKNGLEEFLLIETPLGKCQPRPEWAGGLPCSGAPSPTPAPSRRTVMVNFPHQCGGGGGGLESWWDTAPGCVCEGGSEETSTCTGGVGKAERSPLQLGLVQCTGWGRNRTGGGRANGPSQLRCPSSPALAPPCSCFLACRLNDARVSWLPSCRRHIRGLLSPCNCVSHILMWGGGVREKEIGMRSTFIYRTGLLVLFLGEPQLIQGPRWKEWIRGHLGCTLTHALRSRGCGSLSSRSIRGEMWRYSSPSAPGTSLKTPENNQIISIESEIWRKR